MYSSNTFTEKAYYSVLVCMTSHFVIENSNSADRIFVFKIAFTAFSCMPSCYLGSAQITLWILNHGKQLKKLALHLYEDFTQPNSKHCYLSLKILAQCCFALSCRIAIGGPIFHCLVLCITTYAWAKRSEMLLLLLVAFYTHFVEVSMGLCMC